MCKNKVGGVVVLYKPIIEETLSNIQTYLDDLDILFCIDNSDVSHEQFFRPLHKCRYVSLGKNMGVSYALNIGCDCLIKSGCDILFTFDQDTFFEKGCVRTMSRMITNSNNLFVVSPNIKRVIRDEGKRVIVDKPLYHSSNELVKWTITSGSGFRVELYKKMRQFDSKLFIGQVDVDFCCTVYSLGGYVCRLGNVFMYQELGNAKEHYFFWKKVYTPNLAPIRYYYIFRNERYLRNKWGKKYEGYKSPLLQYVVTVLLYEKDKLKKIINMIKGYKHGYALIHKD